MPTYEYACESCEHRFEKFQSISSRPLRVCPECGKHKVRRLISSGGGIIFKGSGFYETDYRSPEYRKREKEESEKQGGGDSTAKEESKGDSKKNGSESSKSTKESKKAKDTKKSEQKLEGP